MVHNGSKSSVVVDVKAKQRLDPIIVDLKEAGEKDDQGALPHAPQAPQAPQALVDLLTDQLTKAEFRATFLLFSQAAIVTTQA
ncbi:hypothetical protein MTR67_043220 [Solanum verrucosum]|uniref:Uncharacterized protein n=1 Tax=Solanum verrucosum TaxID=315347 RepID=A0AAF0ZUH2_SOLVR|nr:hypothetical protein MTR67_043220 [Solanum verrucosum]